MDAMVRLLALALCLGFASAQPEKQCLTQDDISKVIAAIRAEYANELAEAKATFKEEVHSLTRAFNQELEDIQDKVEVQTRVILRNDIEIAKLQNDVAQLRSEKDATAEGEHTEAKHGIDNATDDKEGTERTRDSRRHGITNSREYNHDGHVLFRKQAATTKVAFSVALDDLSHGQNLAFHQIIQFDKIVSNLGNAYNHHLGAFTAPTSGWYAFSLTMMARPHEVQELEVVNGGVTLLQVHSGGSDFTSATKMTVVHLVQGSEVWVRIATAGFSPNVYGHGHTMFTGWLLYTD